MEELTISRIPNMEKIHKSNRKYQYLKWALSKMLIIKRGSFSRQAQGL